VSGILLSILSKGLSALLLTNISSTGFLDLYDLWPSQTHDMKSVQAIINVNTLLVYLNNHPNLTSTTNVINFSYLFFWAIPSLAYNQQDNLWDFIWEFL